MACAQLPQTCAYYVHTTSLGRMDWGEYWRMLCVLGASLRKLKAWIDVMYSCLCIRCGFCTCTETHISLLFIYCKLATSCLITSMTSSLFEHATLILSCTVPVCYLLLPFVLHHTGWSCWRGSKFHGSHGKWTRGKLGYFKCLPYWPVVLGDDRNILCNYCQAKLMQ